MNILYGLTGSVASKLHVKIKDELHKQHHVIQWVVTESAKQFLNLYEDENHFIYCLDDREEQSRYKVYNTVLHIDLIKWADKFIIAPCTANTLAKFANGICDNLLTNCFRAWDCSKPIVIAPAMNVKMWHHPITKEHLNKLQTWGVKTVYPVEKTLFCGDTGIGAMADINDILQ